MADDGGRAFDDVGDGSVPDTAGAINLRVTPLKNPSNPPLPLPIQASSGLTRIGLPMMITASIFALLGGAFVMITGWVQQVMMVGSMLSTVGFGLIYTLDIGSSAGRWAGFQVYLGAVMAFAIMHGLSIVQAYVGAEDLPAVTANLLFVQTVGGAFSTAAGQSAFINNLLRQLPSHAPTVSPTQVLLTGASELHRTFSADVLPGVLEAYMLAIRAAFAVGLDFCGMAFLVSWAVPWGRMPTHSRGKVGEGGVA